MSVFDPKQSNDFAAPAPSFCGLLALAAAGLPPVLGLIYCLAASPGSPFGPGGPIGPAGPTGPGGPAGPGGPGGPGRPQFSITTSLLSSPEVISTMQVEGNSGPIQRNPPVELLSTCTVLLGLILICTLGSRGRLTLPTIVNSPRVMAAVVMSISARAFPLQVIAQAVVTATARIIFASMSSSVAWNRRPLMGSEI